MRNIKIRHIYVLLFPPYIEHPWPRTKHGFKIQTCVGKKIDNSYQSQRGGFCDKSAFETTTVSSITKISTR